MFEALNATFDGARADGITLLVKSLVLHPALMGVKVMRVRSQVGLFQRFGEAVELAQVQIQAALMLPALRGFLIAGIERFRSLRHMLGGVIPIHDLDTLGEIVRRQVPNPLGAIGRDRQVSGLGE